MDTSLEKPRRAPVPTLMMETTDGRTLHTSDWKGKVVLLDFWASCWEPLPLSSPRCDEEWRLATK